MPIPATSGQLRTDLGSMEIGDYIACRYTALTSGAVGAFSQLGTCIAPEIPVTGSATPDGLFYFIKSDKGLLIADRVIQHSVSWATLNSGRYIEPSSLYVSLIPTMSSDISRGIALTPSSESTSNSREAYRAFDNISSTIWDNSPAGTPGSLTIDFGTEVPISMVEITPSVISSPNYGLKSFDLSYSNDNNTYTPIGSYTHTNDNLPTQYEFPTITARYLKISNMLGYYTTANRVIVSNISVCNLPLCRVRSLSGGVAYIDSSGNMSTSDLSLGGCPIDNEWDKYIVNSNLNGKITAGDNNVWNWNSMYSWHEDTTINNVISSVTGTSSTNTHRTLRGGVLVNTYHFGVFNGVFTTAGFRPVLEYLEPLAKATSLWY